MSLIEINGQENSFSGAVYFGESIGTINKFYTYETFKNVHFIAYKSPVVLPILEDEKFNISHLESPYKVIQSLLTATNNNWINNLTIEENTGNLSQSEIEFRTSTNYKKETKIRVLSELNFENKGIKYSILLVFFPSVNKNMLYPFMLSSENRDWKIYDGYLNELSGLLFLKPEILEKLLKGEVVKNPDYMNFMNLYFHNGKYNLTSEVSFKGQYLFIQNKIYSSITIEKNQLYNIENDIDISVNDFGIIKYWSKEFGLLCTYPDKENPNNQFWATQTKSKYNTTPEEAFASWEFNKDLLEKERHMVVPGKNTIQIKDFLKNAQQGDSTNWQISYQYKVIFYSNVSLYTLLFYKEWFEDNYWGIGSQLMKYKDGAWFVDNSKFTENDAVRLSKMLDAIKFDVLKALLLDERSNNSLIDSFVSKVKDNHGRIFVTDIVDKFNNFCAPELRREKQNIKWP